MSMFEDSRFCWRETYLVMLDSSKRPETSTLVQRLKQLHNRHEIRDICSDSQGLLASLCVIAPNDGAAVEIQYHQGEDVKQEFAALADELERHEPTKKESKKIAAAKEFDAKIEVLHFEQMQDIPGEKNSFPAKLNFPRYSSFVQNLNRELDKNDEPDEFDLAERLDPNTLIQILKLISRLTDGIAFDPASGIVL